MKLIAIEEHILTADVRHAWDDASAADDPTCAFHAGDLGRRLEDLGELRLSLMDEAGIDRQGKIRARQLAAPGGPAVTP